MNPLDIEISDDEEKKAAAVLVPVFEEGNDLRLLFTKRTHTVQHHKGQICFPGGMYEEEDEHLWQTALRESHEEIGLNPGQVSFVFELPKLLTPTMFEITPFVGFIHHDFKVIPNPHEIDSVFTVPISHFRESSNLRFETREFNGKSHNIPFFTYKEHTIWGATGRIIQNLVSWWDE